MQRTYKKTQLYTRSMGIGYKNWVNQIGARGFEPPTLCSQSRCASQAALCPVFFLSYTFFKKIQEGVENFVSLTLLQDTFYPTHFKFPFCCRFSLVSHSFCCREMKTKTNLFQRKWFQWGSGGLTFQISKCIIEKGRAFCAVCTFCIILFNFIQRHSFKIWRKSNEILPPFVR